MNICEHLTRTARLFPDKEAIVFESQRLTYAQLDRWSASAAEHLSEAGVSRGDRVASTLPNVPAFAVWYYAALRIGAIAVSISTRLVEREVSFVVSDCEATALVTAAKGLSVDLGHLPPGLAKCFLVSESGDQCDGEKLGANDSNILSWTDAEPDDPAVILYTSGTTGFAKGATLSHMNVRSNVHAFNHLCCMRPEDRILLSVPLFHCFGQNALMNSAFNVGATLVLQRKFDLTEAKQLIAEEEVTQLYGVPTMFQLLQQSCSPQDLSTVQYCFSAAAPLSVQISRAWQEKFDMPICEGYGLTETSPFASYNHPLQYRLGSIGMPIDAVEMQIVDMETGVPCAAGELGEIVIRGPNVMLGYWNRPEETANAIRDGWFFSGDIGRLDDQGYFYIVDRVKDMIAIAGMKVYPAEVERILLDHPAISDVAVVGFHDEVFGEQVVAFVVPSNTTTLQGEELGADIKEHARKTLANYKVPKQIIALDSLPRNPSGKVLKTKLRELPLPDQQESRSVQGTISDGESQYEQLPAPAVNVKEPTLRTQLKQTHPADRNRIASVFLQDLVQFLTLSSERPDPGARFLDAGMDSLMIVEMSSQLQAEVGDQTDIPATLVFDYPSISDLAEFLVSSLCPVEATHPANGSSDLKSSGLSESNTKGHAPSQRSLDLRQEVESLTEAEALQELMREIGTN